MLTKKLDIFFEYTLWLLLFGITFSNALVEICTGILLALFVIKLIIKKEWKLPSTSQNGMLLAFVIVVFISFLTSSITSSHSQDSFRGFLKVFKYALFFLSLMDFFRSDHRRLQRLFWAVMVVAGITFSNGIFQYFFGFDLIRHRKLDELDYLRRINASFVHPNDFAAYIITVLPLTLTFFCEKLSKKKRIILVFLFLLGSFCLLKTSSRGAWIGFFLATILYFLNYRKKISVVIPILLMMFVLFSPHGFSRIANLFQFNSDTVWERTELWKGTWDMIMEHPIRGFGINTFSDYFPQFKPPLYFDSRYTHNCYLQMWAEIGIIGLSIFLAIIVSILRCIFKKMKQKILMYQCDGLILLGLACGYIGFLIQSAFDTNLYSLVLVTLFWFMTAYALSLSESIEKK